MKIERAIQVRKDEIFEKLREIFQLKIKQVKEQKSRKKYSGPIFDHNEVFSVVESLISGWLGAGEKVDLFQKEFSRFVGQKHSLFVNSGSSANLLAVTALCSYQLGDKRLRPSDEVITPALTFPTTLNPIILNQLTPVFMDVSMNTLNINPRVIEKEITPKTRLLMLPHTLGIPNEMDQILELKEQYNLYLIEDACDALGTTYKGNMVGSFGEFATFSFYPAHQMTTAEGGMIVSSSKKLIRIAQQLRDWGRGCYCQWGETKPKGTCGKRFDYDLNGIKYDHKYIYEEIGYNLKPTEMQGAFAVVQLKRVPEFIQKRKENYLKLFNGLKIFEEYFHFPASKFPEEISWFAFPLVIKPDAPFSRTELLKWLEKDGIETRPLLAGNILHHPAYSNLKFKQIGNLSVTEQIFENAFFLGIFPGLNEADLSMIIDSFNQFTINMKNKY